VNPRTGEPSPLVSQELWEITMKNKDLIDNVIDYSKDFEYDYFGFKTLERSYLLKMNGRIVERPQHMLVNVLLFFIFDSPEKSSYCLSSTR
jgi:ribonucleoside-diphosphate reductase alpha chain